MNRKYSPRRASKRWLEGAPDYILDCLDDPRTVDRYTIIFCGDDWIMGDGTYAGTRLHYLGCSAGGLGFSQFGEFSAYDCAGYRYANKHRRVRWLDIPEETRRHIISRVESD